jgi:hypothetical protein
MSLLFLLLSAAFFLLPQFRQAMLLPFIYESVENLRPAPFATIPAEKLHAWAREGESQRDAPTLAFVALRTRDAKEGARLADLAVSLDPKLGWIYHSMISVTGERKSKQSLEWARKLQQFDPENAIGYLQEAEHFRENSEVFSRSQNLAQPEWDKRLQQTAWRAAMEKAFAAPRYDGYNLRRFLLERTFMRDRGMATPMRLVYSIASYPIPNLLNIREYANLVVLKLGKDAENAKRTKEALEHYWKVAHFGERMQLGPGASLIEQLMAMAVQRIAYVPLAALLRSSGQGDAAATLDYIDAEMKRRTEALAGRDLLALTSNAMWNGLLVAIFVALVVILGAATLLSVAFVNLKRWFRKDKQGVTYATVTTAENYLPVGWFIVCLGLYISYYPYARNFQHYMVAFGDMNNLESVVFNSLALPWAFLPGQQLPLGNPFLPYAWYALGALVLAVVLAFAGGRPPKPAGGTT